MAVHKLPSHIQHIIFDADDTLWPNNYYFVEATENFIRLWVNAGMEEKAARQTFLDFEKKAVAERGYGSANFIYILQEVYRRLSPVYKVPRSSLDLILQNFKKHRDNGPVLFPGVRQIIETLHTTHALYILTKGRHEEQREKIRRSGLEPFMKELFIVPEKDVEVYAGLLTKHQWRPDTVCMVGNSPKSDINPALRCGMYAVYIPYEHTWHLDHDTIEQPDHPQLRYLERISELPELF